MITFLCVFKKYNNQEYSYNYTENDVFLLKEQIEKFYTKKHDFYCLTDSTEIDFCKTIPLTENYKFYWSKIELFKHNFEKCVYFDLDLIIQKNIDWLDDIDINEKTFVTMPIHEYEYNKTVINSSFMLWNGNKKFIFENFDYDSIIKNNYYKYSGTTQYSKKILKINVHYRVGDQGYIFDTLIKNKIKIRYIGTDKITFFKASNIQERKNTCILVFTGYPKHKMCYFNEKYECYTLKEEDFNTNNIMSILLTEHFNEELINYVVNKLSKKVNNNYTLLKNKHLIYSNMLDVVKKHSYLNFWEKTVIEKINKYEKELNQFKLK